MKYNLYILYFIIISILVAQGCNKNDKNAKQHLYQLVDRENCLIVDNLDEWERIKDVKIHETNCKKMSLRFMNNPYSLNDNDTIAISLYNIKGSDLIYRGVFKSSIDVCIPHTRTDTICTPGLEVFRNGKTHHLISGKLSIDIKNSDDYLYIVFMPDRGVVGGCQMFSSGKQFN